MARQQRIPLCGALRHRRTDTEASVVVVNGIPMTVTEEIGKEGGAGRAGSVCLITIPLTGARNDIAVCDSYWMLHGRRAGDLCDDSAGGRTFRCSNSAEPQKCRTQLEEMI